MQRELQIECQGEGHIGMIILRVYMQISTDRGASGDRHGTLLRQVTGETEEKVKRNLILVKGC